MFGLDHFDRVPGADLQVVGVRFLAWDVDADFATDTAFQIDLAETLKILELVVLLDLEDTIDRADFQTSFAARAVIGIDNRQLLGKFLTGACFSHL